MTSINHKEQGVLWGFIMSSGIMEAANKLVKQLPGFRKQIKLVKGGAL